MPLYRFDVFMTLAWAARSTHGDAGATQGCGGCDRQLAANLHPCFHFADRGAQLESHPVRAEPGHDGLRGRLRLVAFDNAQRLQKDGASTFNAPQGVQSKPAEFPHVIQGALEQSNVKAVVEMTRMIEVTRNYTQVATLLQQQGDMRRSAIERLADVPA